MAVNARRCSHTPARAGPLAADLEPLEDGPGIR